MKRFWRRKSDFATDERGSATIEALLWIPVYLAFIAILIDASTFFHGYSKAQRIAQDVNRLALAGYYNNPDGSVNTTDMKAAADSMIQGQYGNGSAAIFADADIVQTQLIVPASDLAVMGFLTAVIPIEIKVSAAHAREG